MCVSISPRSILGAKTSTTGQTLAALSWSLEESSSLTPSGDEKNIQRFGMVVKYHGNSLYFSHVVQSKDLKFDSQYLHDSCGLIML